MQKEIAMFRLAVILCAIGAPAFANPQCAPRDEVLALLADRFGESRRAVGLAGQSAVMELFAADGGTWSITMTLPDGKTCLIASGTAFEVQAAPIPGIDG